MLQKLDAFEWPDPDRYQRGQYAPGAKGEYITISDATHPKWYYEILLPPGVVLAQEVDAPASAPAPADPFVPSEEVRNALRTVFHINPPASYVDFGAALEMLESWVRSWPNE